MSTLATPEGDGFTCEWEGPYSFRQLLESSDHQIKYASAGVYLWVDQDPRAAKQLCYVGRAMGKTTLWIRQWEHYTALIGAQYQLPAIPEANELAWGMKYSDPNVVATVFDYQRYIALVRRGFDYAERIRIWLCRLKDPEVAKTIERQLIWQFQPDDTMRGTKYPPVTLRSIIHVKAGWLNASIRAQIKDGVEFAPEADGEGGQ